MEFSESLKKNPDFYNVYRKGTSHADRLLVLYVFFNGGSRNRLGISVSKRVGNSIVRHRLARLIRESYRLNEKKFKCGYDMVAVARVNAKGASYHEVERTLLKLAHSLSILI